MEGVELEKRGVLNPKPLKRVLVWIICGWHIISSIFYLILFPGVATKENLHIFGGDFILIFRQLFHLMVNMTSR